MRTHPKTARAAPAGWDRFYAVVKRIPRGRVTTYGAVALLGGMPRGGRHVGFALAALRGTSHAVPWHRVLGARGRGHAGVSLLDATGGAIQRTLLEAEGVAFDARDRVSLDDFGWFGASRRAGKPPPLTTSRRTRGPRRSG